jgi:restriction endonuclease S subunit
MAITKVTSYAMLDSESRCDAEHIAAPIFVTRNYHYGNDVVEFTQYGTSKQLNENGKGFPVLRLNEFEQMFIKSPEKHCNLINESVYQQLRLSKGDVLVCRTNGNPHLVGKAAVVMEDVDCAYASYVFKVRPNHHISPQLLTVYLNGKYGRSEIERHQMISIQTNFSPERFKKCRVPCFSHSFQTGINKLVDKAYSNLKNSKVLYAAIEKYLLDTLGMTNFRSTASKFSIKGLAESFNTTNRIDAEYYQQKYEHLINHLLQYKCVKLGTGIGKIVTIEKSIEPGSEYYRDTGTPFVRVSDITKFGISSPSIKIPPELTKLRPKAETILLSKDGSVGIAYKIEQDLDIITSGALLHLNIIRDDVLPDYLTLVLNSQIVQMQAERDAGGSIIQHWKPSEIAEVIIPLVDYSVQETIAEDVKRSFALRRESERLLEAAKRAVEIAIEVDETSAMSWLDKEMEGVTEQ